MRLFVVSIISCCLILSCKTRKKRKDSWGDYSLSMEQSTEQNRSVALSGTDVAERPSFPLPIRVGKGKNGLKVLPKVALGGSKLAFAVTRRECRLYIYSSTPQVDRFLFTNKWVKFKESLTKGIPVKLDRKQHASFRVHVGLKVHIKREVLQACRKELYDKHFEIGRVDLGPSRIFLIPSPGSKAIKFTKRSRVPHPRRLFLNWKRGEKLPIVLDSYDIPVSLETPIYRAFFGKKGYYFLGLELKANFQKYRPFEQKKLHLSSVSTVEELKTPVEGSSTDRVDFEMSFMKDLF